MIRSALAAALVLSGCGSGNNSVSFDRAGKDDLAHGERLARVLGCSGCHGEDLTGQDWSSDGFVEMSTANLTQAAARWSPEQFEATLRSGTRPDGRELWDMPSHLFTRLSDSDMKALLAYLYSRPRRGKTHPAPVFHEQARKEMAAGIYKSAATEVREFGQKPAPQAGPGHEQARYIVRTACAECHGVDLRGGVPFPGAPFRPDLRMVEAYDKDDFLRLLTSGQAAGGRELNMMSDVGRNRYAHLTPAEREAIHAYLVALAKKDP